MMAKIRGTREGRQAFTRALGTGSSWQIGGFDLRLMSKISEVKGSLDGWKTFRKDTKMQV